MNSKEPDLLPTVNPLEDGDYEFQHKLVYAKDLYMKGFSVSEVAERAEIKKYTLHNYVFKGSKGEEPWVEQRKKARTEFVKECQELTKVSLSKAYRASGETYFQILDSLIKELPNMKPYEKIKAADTVIRGVKELHNIFMPAMKSPLVNIALQNNPKMSDSEVIEQLIDWGLQPDDEQNRSQEG